MFPSAPLRPPLTPWPPLEDGTITADDIIWVADREHADRYEPYVRTTGYLAQEAAANGTLPRDFYRVFASDTEALLAYDQCMLERKKKNTNNIDLTQLENQDELDIHGPFWSTARAPARVSPMRVWSAPPWAA